MSGNSTEATATDRNHQKRLQIDEEIQTLEARLLELRSARNQLAPITKCSAEILTTIFLIARDEYKYPWGQIPLIVTRVCHDWRVAALNFPSLWNVINSPNPGLVKAFLERSKQRRILSSLQLTGSKHLPSVLILMESLSRIKLLSLGATGAIIVCGSHWDAPAPKLRQLMLRNYKLPGKLFSGVHPLLQEVYLTTCVFNWNHLPLSSILVSLHIVKPHSSISATMLVSILQSLPELQRLHISRVLSGETQTARGPYKQPLRVSLPKISTIYMREEPAGAIDALFSRLTISPKADISIHSLQTADPTDIYPTIGAIRSSRHDPTWHILQLWVNFNTSFNINIVETDSTQSSSIRLSFHLCPPSSRPFSQGHLLSLLSIIPLASLQLFDIRGQLESDYEPRLWRLALGSLPNLQSLGAFGLFSSHLIHYLKGETTKIIAADQRGTPSSIIKDDLTFRALSSLYLGDLNLSPPNYEDIGHIRWILTHRELYLERLSRLMLFVSSPLPDEVLDSLSHVVTEISQQVRPPQSAPNQGGGSQGNIVAN